MARRSIWSKQKIAFVAVDELVIICEHRGWVAPVIILYKFYRHFSAERGKIDASCVVHCVFPKRIGVLLTNGTRRLVPTQASRVSNLKCVPYLIPRWLGQVVICYISPSNSNHNRATNDRSCGHRGNCFASSHFAIRRIRHWCYAR